MTITKQGCARGIAQITLALIVLIFLLVGFAYGGDKIISIITFGQLDRQAAARQHEREERVKEAQTETEIAKAENLRWLEIVASGSWLALKGGIALVILLASGSIVVAFWRLALGQTLASKAGWSVLQTHAARQPVPQNLTYSPTQRIQYSIKNNKEGAPLELVKLANLPSFTDLKDISLPTPDKALLGLMGEGKTITNKWTKAKHICIIGPTGGGKSVLSKTLIVQSLRAGHDVHILDPHFTAFDAESGEDWTPITSCLQAQPVTQVEDIVNRLKWAVGEMNHRLELREQREKYLPYIIRIVLDEIPAIVEQSKEAAGLISRILREGRKVGILLQLAAQDMLAATLGFKNGAAVRKNFSTAFLMRDCDPVSARLFIKNKEFNPDMLEVGAAGIVTEGIRGHSVARIPFTSNEAVQKILGGAIAQPAQSTPKALPVPTAQNSAIAHDEGGGATPKSSEIAPRNCEPEQNCATAILPKGLKGVVYRLLDANPELASQAQVLSQAINKPDNYARQYIAEWRKDRGIPVS